jgi:hypothetical protein
MVSRLRVLRAFVQVYLGKTAPAYKALWLAESGDRAELEDARLEFERIPALQRRRVLGSYAAHWAFKAQRAAEDATKSGKSAATAK